MSHEVLQQSLSQAMHDMGSAEDLLAERENPNAPYREIVRIDTRSGVEVIITSGKLWIRFDFDRTVDGLDLNAGQAKKLIAALEVASGLLLANKMQ